MTGHDSKYMKESIVWAQGCKPRKAAIPKVGAIIAVEDEVIGRGRRGTGEVGDDHHAEWDAFESVTDRDKPLLPKATLYTTLEPCTAHVRSDPLTCCTELIIQHEISRVFVGMLDPNQGVTGKGLLRLQDAGVEVALFPHDLAQQIRTINVEFIRTQQTFDATIISPHQGEQLRTYQTGGRHAVRFKCLNAPTTNNHLLTSRNGRFWPQSGQFRHVQKDVWEIDANFGSTGIHTLSLITANDLGNVLMGYYKEVVRENKDRRERVEAKLGADLSLLGGDYIGIQMGGFPKGIRLEASVVVNVLPAPGK